MRSSGVRGLVHPWGERPPAEGRRDPGGLDDQFRGSYASSCRGLGRVGRVESPRGRVKRTLEGGSQGQEEGEARDREFKHKLTKEEVEEKEKEEEGPGPQEEEGCQARREKPSQQLPEGRKSALRRNRDGSQRKGQTASGPPCSTLHCSEKGQVIQQQQYIPGRSKQHGRGRGSSGWAFRRDQQSEGGAREVPWSPLRGVLKEHGGQSFDLSRGGCGRRHFETGGPAILPPRGAEEMHGSTAALDHLARGRPAHAGDVLAQRLKAMESSINGAHWSVSQKLEVAHPEASSIARRLELHNAQRETHQENRTKYLSGIGGQKRDEKGGKGKESKGGAKGKDRKGRGGGDHDGAKGGKKDAK